MRPRRLAVGFLIFFFVAGGSLPAAAQDQQDATRSQAQGRWWVMPAGTDGQPIGARTHLFYDVVPGQVLFDALLIVNPTDAPINFQLYPSDAYNLPPVGSLALRSPEEELTGVGSWVDLRIRELTVESGKQVEVPFALRIPADAEPGDNVGGIVVLNVDPEEAVDAGDVQLGLRRSIGVRIYARVDGPLREELAVRNIRVDHTQRWLPFIGRSDATVTYEVVNTGNVRLRPDVRSKVTGLFGRTIGTVETERLPEILPRGAIERKIELEGLPFIDRLTVDVRAVASSVEGSGFARFWLLPWPFIVLIIVLVGFVLWYWRRRRRERRVETTAADLPPEKAPVRS